MFQSSSTCAAVHASSVVSRPAASASASSAEPVSVVTTLSAPSRQASLMSAPLGIALRRRSDRRLAAAPRASRPRPARSARRVFRRAHSTIGSQCCRWLATRAVRPGGAIEQQVGAEVFLDLGRDRCGRRRNAVDDRVGEPGERHRRRVDLVLLRVPFRGQRLRQLAHRRGQQGAAPACAPAGRRAAPGSPQPPRPPSPPDRTAP